MATTWKPEDVPDELVDVAHAHYSMHGHGLVRNILAAVLPKHAEMVLRQATKQQWERMLAEVSDEHIAGRLAELEKTIREKVAREIEMSVCQPGEQCPDRFCPDCIRYAQAQRDARIARGEPVTTNPTTEESQ